MVRFSPWPTFLRIFRSFCCSEISTSSSASFVMSNRYWNHVWNAVSNLWSRWWAGEQVKVRVPGDSAGTSAGGLHSRRSGSAGAPRFWSSCQSAPPRARSCERWSWMCSWGDRRLLLWRTCTSLWTTSCRSENKTIFFKHPEILKHVKWRHGRSSPELSIICDCNAKVASFCVADLWPFFRANNQNKPIK